MKEKTVQDFYKPLKKKRRFLKILFIFFFIFTGSAYAVIYFSEKWENKQSTVKLDSTVTYRWQDENGQWQHSSHPPAGIRSIKISNAYKSEEPPWYVKVKDDAITWIDDTKRTFNISKGKAEISVRKTQDDISESVSGVKEGVKEVKKGLKDMKEMKEEMRKTMNPNIDAEGEER